MGKYGNTPKKLKIKKLKENKTIKTDKGNKEAIINDCLITGLEDDYFCFRNILTIAYKVIEE